MNMRVKSILLLCCFILAGILTTFSIGFAADQESNPIKNDYYKDSATYQKTWLSNAQNGNHINIYVENRSDSETAVQAELYLPDSDGTYVKADLLPGQHQVWSLENENGIQGEFKVRVTEPDGRQMYIHVAAKQYNQDMPKL